MNEIEKKEVEYKSYIEEHVSNVWVSFKRLLELFGDGMTTSMKTELAARCIFHDMSKYDIEEFYPYRKNHHPINEEEKKLVKKEYDRAWKRHYTLNDHHWEHWKIDKKGEDVDSNYGEMKVVALLELICDWMAMSIKFNNTVKDYYMKEKKKIHFHPSTRKLFLKIIEKYDL